jgi:5-methylcytosine-specific restriction endonuclease McrA
VSLNPADSQKTLSKHRIILDRILLLHGKCEGCTIQPKTAERAKMAKWDRLDVYQRDEFRCLYCGFDGSTFEGWRYLTVDHINPTGPRDELDNLATSCSYCNSCKGSDACKSLEEARELVKAHDANNRVYWESRVRPKMSF